MSKWYLNSDLFINIKYFSWFNDKYSIAGTQTPPPSCFLCPNQGQWRNYSKKIVLGNCSNSTKYVTNGLLIFYPWSFASGVLSNELAVFTWQFYYIRFDVFFKLLNAIRKPEGQSGLHIIQIIILKNVELCCFLKVVTFPSLNIRCFFFPACREDSRYNFKLANHF